MSRESAERDRFLREVGAEAGRPDITLDVVRAGYTRQPWFRSLVRTLSGRHNSRWTIARAHDGGRMLVFCSKKRREELHDGLFGPDGEWEPVNFVRERDAARRAGVPSFAFSSRLRPIQVSVLSMGDVYVPTWWSALRATGVNAPALADAVTIMVAGTDEERAVLDSMLRLGAASAVAIRAAIREATRAMRSRQRKHHGEPKKRAARRKRRGADGAAARYGRTAFRRQHRS